MFGNFIDKFLGGQEELDKELIDDQKEENAGKNELKIKTNYFELVLIFLLATVPRLLYVFLFSNPNFTGWYTDVFHHWQIAFLSKEIGFHQGFLRLWDFKGMEFFWGLLHPLVLVVIFYITGSISILIPRLLSIFGGSITIVLLFLIIKRYFNRASAWAAVLFAAFFPITLFSNTVGMQEELGMPLILGAMLMFPQAPIIGGVLFALASMVRAEYWLFSAGLTFITVFLNKNVNKSVVLISTYLVIIFFYMKYLAGYTGNWIYPIYWNFLASVRGDWFVDLPVIGEKLLAKQISQGIFAFGVVGALATLIKKPRSALFLLFGFGNIIFIGFMVGFGAYVKGYIPRFWVDRLYNWPYLFTAILMIIFSFYYLPKVLAKLKPVIYVFSWIFLTALIFLSQLIWKPINYFMQPVANIYNTEKVWAKEIADNYVSGKVLMPEDRPYITYFLAHDYKIKGSEMVGQMFDPFFYFDEDGKKFKNWGEDREKVLDWLKKENIALIALTVKKETYLGLFEREPEFFTKLPSENVILYKVNFD